MENLVLYFQLLATYKKQSYELYLQNNHYKTNLLGTLN